MEITDSDAFVLRRAVAKMSIDEFPASAFLKTLLARWVRDEAGYRELNDFLKQDSELLLRVMQVDPYSAPKPAERDEPKIAYIPELPREAVLSEKMLARADEVAHWWRTAGAWAIKRSPMTPPHFLEMGMVWLAGLAIARRACLHLHTRIFPHLYYLIVAETSRFAKSTGMGVIKTIADELFPYMLIPGSATSEALMEILSGQQPSNYDKLSQQQKKLLDDGRRFAGQRGIILDEYSSLLGSSKKDYMQGFVELLMRLYDANEQEQHYTRSGGHVTITRPALSIFGATTPAAMARALNNETWENGEMARYFIMFRGDVLPYSDSYGDLTIPTEVISPLRNMSNNLPKPRELFDEDDRFQAETCTITQEAHRAYQAYAKAVRYTLLEEADPRLHGNYTRLHVQAMKIAISLACVDAEGKNPVIESGHWAIAQQMTEYSRRNLHNLLLVLNETKDSRNQTSLINLLRKNPAGLTVRDFCRLSNAYANDVRNALEVLLDSGDVLEIEHKPISGRPTKIYKLANGL